MVYICDNAFEAEEILRMEHSILSTLEFDIAGPSAYRFLERFAQIAEPD